MVDRYNSLVTGVVTAINIRSAQLDSYVVCIYEAFINFEKPVYWAEAWIHECFIAEATRGVSEKNVTPFIRSRHGR